MCEWDTQRSCFEFLHRAISEQLALCITRVALDFFRALMTGNGGDLMRCCPRLCERCGTGLAQSVSRTMMHIRLVRPITHGIAKSGRGVRLPVLGNEER